jgi:epoxyqueuosine reductase
MGIANTDPSAHGKFFKEWVDRGFHGEMAYLARPDAVARRGDLRGTMEDVRSVVVLAQDYYQEDSPGIPGDLSRGIVARYARGEDYHDVLKDRLQDLLVWVRQEARGRGLAKEVQGFAYVDTGPILERELGKRAGMGWFGNNTMLINPRRGSYSFLGLLLLDLPLPSDSPFEADFCGSCRACLDACPTGALLGRDACGAPVMDARRCISYLTIELRGPIPRELRPAMGNRIFGCDICQEVCPFTRKFSSPLASSSEYAARPELDGPPLIELTSEILSMSGKGYIREFRDSSVSRARRNGMLRNLCVALGNWGSSEAVPILAKALSDSSPLVRVHAAWALGEIGSDEAVQVVRARSDSESDLSVLEEIRGVLSRASDT